MAEYGRHSRVTSIVRFINDILLSAPSIVVGLFIYQVIVRGSLRPFLGATPAAIALAVIATPVIVRTTEDMLNLVPVDVARSRLGFGHAALAGDPADRLSRRPRRPRHRRASGDRPRQRRDRAFAVHRSLNNPASSAWDPNAPMSSLPAVIFPVALASPYPEWQQLAWTGALLVTLAAVLGMSILARTLAPRAASR